MKVILTQDVKNLGKKDDMVEVNDGYARNFLLPRGLAVEANARNMNIMKSRKEAEQSKKERELKEAQEVANRLKDVVLTIKAKSGENGKLFGSITSMDISNSLKSQFNVNVDKKKIVLNDPIKMLGTYEIELKLYPTVTGKLILKVVGE